MAMASATTGTVSAALAQNRRRMSTSSGLRLVDLDGARLERHAALGAVARLVRDDLGCMGTSTRRARRRRHGLGLERHAALRAGDGLVLAHLGAHGQTQAETPARVAGAGGGAPRQPACGLGDELRAQPSRQKR